MTVRTQARKAKKRLGPRLNKAIMDTLNNEVGYKAVLTTHVHHGGQAQSGCLHLQHQTCGKDITVDMSAGGVNKHVLSTPEPQYITDYSSMLQIQTPYYCSHHNSPINHRLQITLWCK